jgi:hypothetical protein
MKVELSEKQIRSLSCALLHAIAHLEEQQETGDTELTNSELDTQILEWTTLRFELVQD